MGTGVNDESIFMTMGLMNAQTLKRRELELVRVNEPVPLNLQILPISLGPLGKNALAFFNDGW